MITSGNPGMYDDHSREPGGCGVGGAGVGGAGVGGIGATTLRHGWMAGYAKCSASA